MISPKEKAEQLIAKFLPHSHYWDCYNDEPVKENHAKQCALICIEEQIKLLQQLRKPEYTTFITDYENGTFCEGYEYVEFWEAVRTEILNTED